MKVLRVVFSFIFFLFILHHSSFIIQKASADTSNYKTVYNVTYTIDDDETAHTTMKIGLTNQSSKYYATSYKLQIGFNDVTNIRASDTGGAITPVLRKIPEGYEVELEFNDQIVGVGNTLHFTISFDTKSIAKQHGKLWEITIPSTSQQDTFSDFTVTVNPPASFGTPTVVRPKISGEKLEFSKKDLKLSGISILFGTRQDYTFDLLYHLKNNNVFPIQTEIALPPSTNYQDTSIESITPRPLNVLMDSDGNWLAQYHLSPSQRLDVRVKGKATLTLYPKSTLLSEGERKKYTEELAYWSTSEEMKQLAKDLKTPKNIYEYVVKTLSYDYSRRTSTNETRIGARDILQKPENAVCLEFTDLFIALSRAAGIPAREVDGYAFTDNEAERPLSLIPDILHAWPEYYDEEKKAWVMVDPTWGNTTNGMDYFSFFDLSHLTFVIKGVDSTYPVPAGGYKLSEKDIDSDVTVNFAKDFIPPNQNFSVDPEVDETALAGFPIHGSVIVKNIGYGLSKEQTIRIQSSTLLPHQQSISLPPLPPGGQKVLSFSFQKTPFLTKGKHTFTMVIADTKIHEDIFVTPFLITKWHLLGGFILVILSIVVFITATKARRIPFFRHKR